MTTTHPFALIEWLTGPTKALNLRLSERLLEEVSSRAARDGRDRAWVVRALLCLYATGQIDLAKLAREAGL